MALKMAIAGASLTACEQRIDFRGLRSDVTITTCVASRRLR